MKNYYVLVLMASVLSAAAMEKPSMSKKRPAEEEQPAAAQKVKREEEQAAIIHEPAIQMEAQRELSPEVKAQVNYLRSVAERGEFPNEIAAQILKNLAKVKVRGATEEQKLYNAIANIRAFMEAFPQFYGDVGINGYLIQELAKRYTGGDSIKVAIALATTGAGNWLAAYVGGADKKRWLVGLLLTEAARLKELATVRFILQYLPQMINEPAVNKSTALMFAAENGDLPILQRLLQVPEINVNAQNESGFTALIYAAINGNIAVVERLLQAPGINVNAQTTRHGGTALMAAASHGHAAVVERLLQAPGIEVNARTTYEATALGSARQSNNPNKDAIIKRLIEFGAIE